MPVFPADPGSAGVVTPGALGVSGTALTELRLCLVVWPGLLLQQLPAGAAFI